MKSLVVRALENRVAANLFAFLILIIGLMMASMLNMRMFPKLTLYNIAITVPYPGATPQDVEHSIIKPIEDSLEGLEGINKITALASNGVASVIVDIDESYSISKMLDDIETEINRITLFPLRAEAPQIVQAENLELAATLVLYGDASSLRLKELAQQVKSQLTAIDGISRVSVGGAPPNLIDIEVSADTAEAIGLSHEEIAARVALASQDLSGGQIEGATQNTLIRATGERKRGIEFSDIVVSTGELAAPLMLSSIATITDDLSDEAYSASFQNKPAVFININRVGDESAIDIVQHVREFFSVELKSALPPNVKAYFWQDESKNLEDRIALLTSNAVVGLALVIALLLGFLDIRIAMWVAFGVSLSFVGAFALMGVFDISINMLSLFGFILAIGIVVDDAIVVGENMHRSWRATGGSPMEASKRSVLRVSTPVLFSVSTTIVAFLPLLALPGTFGQFLAPIAAVVIFVLLLSLFDSFFILPHHLGHLREGKPRKYSPRRIADPFRNWVASHLDTLTNKYVRKVVSFAADNAVAVLMVSFGFFFAALTTISSGAVKTQAFPAVDGDFITANLEMAESSSQALTKRFAQDIAQAAIEAGKQLDASDSSALEGVLWAMGGGLGQDDALASPEGGAAANKAQIIALIQEATTRQFEALDFVKLWREKVGSIPGAERLTFSVDLVNPGAPIQLQVSTNKNADTISAVTRISDALSNMDGIYDVSDDRFRNTDEIQIKIKPWAHSLGLSQSDIARQVRSAFFGAEATRIQRNEEEIQVRVRLPEEERASLAAINSLLIDAGERFVPLSQVAELTIVPVPTTITRVNGRNVLNIEAYVINAVSTADDANAYILNEFMPSLQEEFEGLKVQVEGSQEEFGKTAPALARNFLIALLTIYTLLAMNFKSYSQPIIVLLAIPFGFMGALLGHFILGMNLSLLSFFGIIGLSGVIINHSLMVINFLNERLKRHEEPRRAVIESMLERFRAILLTTLTTFLGVTPIILETSLQAQFLIPTAASLGFGILIGTLMLILTLPALAVSRRVRVVVLSSFHNSFSQAAGG